MNSKLTMFHLQELMNGLKPIHQQDKEPLLLKSENLLLMIRKKDLKIQDLNPMMVI